MVLCRSEILEPIGKINSRYHGLTKIPGKIFCAGLRKSCDALFMATHSENFANGPAC